MSQKSAVRSRNVIGVFAKGYLPDHGGIERYSTDISEAYGSRGHRVYVLTQTSIGPSVRRNRNVIIFDVGTGSQAVLFVRFVAASRRIFKDIEPRFIHATSWRVALPAFFCGKIAPIVVTVHGREVFIVPLFLRPLMHLILSRCAAVVVVSNAIRSSFEIAYRSRTTNWTTVWNGLSFRREAEEASEKHRRDVVRLYTFCRLIERKNVRSVIEAVALLKKRGVVGFVLDVAGDGPERAALEALVERAGLKDIVRFLGYLPEETVVDRYRDMDVFVHPQIASSGGKDIEGFGLTIADAMSFGLAVVVGRDGGPSDFVKDGETGLVVDGHDVEAIANALQSLIVSPSHLEEIRKRGRKWALSELDWTKAVDRIDAAVEMYRTGRQ